MACQSCITALEGSASTIYELAHFHAELLPPLPERLNSWAEVGALLVQAAGNIRQRQREA